MPFNTRPRLYSLAVQITYHSVVEAPGKLVVHVRLQPCWIKPAYISYIPQTTLEAENPIGLDTKYEAIYIVHFVTDDDGSLKAKQLDEFIDSNVYPGIHKALAETEPRK